MPSPTLLADRDGYVAVYKPSGWVCHRGWAQDKVTLTDWVAVALGPFHLLHRLDRGTSGPVLFAKTAEAARLAGAWFESGIVEKSYVAVVRGPVRVSDQTVSHPLCTDPEDKASERVEAQTRMACLENWGRLAFVRCQPLTGRTHQIRRHLKHLHHPIVGDTTYGRGEVNRWARARLGLFRMALHCESIRLPPLDWTVEVPLPDDVALACKRAQEVFSSMPEDARATFNWQVDSAPTV